MGGQGDYVVLCKLTAEGAKRIMQMPQLMQDQMQKAEAMGIKIVGQYLLFGQYDWIYLLEAPDDETITMAMLGLVAQGLVISETLRAFDLAATTQMFQKLG